MRLLFLLILSLPAFAQQQTYNRVTFDFMPADSTVKAWNRSMKTTVTVTIDTVKKQVIIPNCQVYATTSTRRNMLTDQVTTISDTNLVLSGTTTLPIIAPINVSSDGYARGIYLSNKMGALLLPDYFFIIYPVWGRYCRVIEFSNN